MFRNVIFKMAIPICGFGLNANDLSEKFFTKHNKILKNMQFNEFGCETSTVIEFPGLKTYESIPKNILITQCFMSLKFVIFFGASIRIYYFACTNSFLDRI